MNSPDPQNGINHVTQEGCEGRDCGTKEGRKEGEKEGKEGCMEMENYRGIEMTLNGLNHKLECYFWALNVNCIATAGGLI